MVSDATYRKYSDDPDLQALADKGEDATAQFVYGCKLAQVEWTSKPPSLLAISYIERAANNGCADADYWLADYYLRAPDNNESTTLKEKGLARLESAMLQGSFEAAATLGYLHFQKNTPQDAAISTQLWNTALRNEKEKTALKASQYLCERLSFHFAVGSYGYERKSSLAGQLCILSATRFGFGPQPKDLFLVLSQIKEDNPTLFNRFQAQGLEWISELDVPKILLYDDEIKRRQDQREEICLRFFAIINYYNTELGHEINAYLKSKLPLEIQNIPNLKFDLEG